MWSLAVVVLACITSSQASFVHRTSQAIRNDNNYTFIDNGVIKVGVNLDRGGSIGWVSAFSGPHAGQNLVNEHDMGREIQLSYYAAPAGFDTPKKNCSRVQSGPYVNFPWNPIGAGDLLGHSGTVLRVNVAPDRRSMVIISHPIMWACDNVPCQCVFEKHLTLSGAGVTVKATLYNARTDNYAFQAMGQELPAVYVVAGFRQAVTYQGDAPWTNAPVTMLPPGNSQFSTGERWAATVDKSGWGLGLTVDDVYDMAAIPNIVPGDPGSDPPHEDATGYLNANRLEYLTNTIVYEFTFSVVLGHYNEIRQWAHDRAFNISRPMKGPSWVFGNVINPRAGFNYSPLVRDSTDAVAHAVRIIMTADDKDPQIHGPTLYWYTADVPAVVVNANFSVAGLAQIFFHGINGQFTEDCVANFNVSPGIMSYTVSLKAVPCYSALKVVTNFRLDPLVAGPGLMDIRSISVAG